MNRDLVDPAKELRCYACHKVKPRSEMCDDCHGFATDVNVNRVTDVLRSLWRYLEREHGDWWMKDEKREHALRVTEVLGERRQGLCAACGYMFGGVGLCKCGRCA